MHDNSSNTPRPIRRVIQPGRSRDTAPAQLPDMLLKKQQELERQAELRMQRLREKFESAAVAPPASAEAPTATARRRPGGLVPDRPTPDDATSAQAEDDGARSAPTSPSAVSKRRGKVKRRKEYLEPKQHARLRDQIEHLWAVDKRFRNWSLLARAAGLSSGQAVKRAYEVNSSMATLRNIDTFARLHAGFGSKATRALKAGIPIDELQAHLMAGKATADSDAEPRGDAADDASGRGGRAAGGRGAADSGSRPSARRQVPTLTMDELGDTPPSVDFDSLVETGKAVDTEVKRLWLVARFFEQMSEREQLPRLVREGASTARDHVLKAVAQFAGGAPAQDAAPTKDGAPTSGDLAAAGPERGDDGGG